MLYRLIHHVRWRFNFLQVTFFNLKFFVSPYFVFYGQYIRRLARMVPCLRVCLCIWHNTFEKFYIKCTLVRNVFTTSQCNYVKLKHASNHINLRHVFLLFLEECSCFIKWHTQSLSLSLFFFNTIYIFILKYYSLWWLNGDYVTVY